MGVILEMMLSKNLLLLGINAKSYRGYQLKPMIKVYQKKILE